MSERLVSNEATERIAVRDQTLGEEIANSVTHGLALLCALIGAPFLILHARAKGFTNIVTVSCFAFTMALLYLTSTLYHALPPGRGKRVFMRLDHAAIYIFIAGSYTPFALGALHGGWGWTLFGLAWSMAIVGVTLKALNILTNVWLSTGLYLAMGWLVLIAAVPLAHLVKGPGIALLVAGGLAYSVGVIFFMLDSRVRYAHAIWHAFVALGTAFHFFAVLGYAA